MNFNKFIKSIIQISIINILFCSICLSQFDRLRRDGLWWVSIGEMNKPKYIIGYFLGSNFGPEVVTEKFPKNSKCWKKAMDTYNYFGREMIELNPDYVSSRIDSLYKDTLNLGLMTFHAVWIVSNQILNTDSTRLKREIEIYRKEDCDKFKNLEELKKYKLPY